MQNPLPIYAQIGTKDADILEMKDAAPALDAQLRSFAGKGTDIHKRLRLYIDVVKRAILFLPQRPIFHPIADISLKYFKIEAPDIRC